MTYFKRPVGRATDGRLIVDFLAEALGLPCISPYLKSIGPDYKHKANYATLASTVLLPNLHQSSDQQELIRLPSPDVIGKSLYTLYIGQNDFTSNLGAIGVVSSSSGLTNCLYHQGGRAFLVLNLAPVGCYPSSLVGLPPSELDAFGCSIAYSNAVVDHNNMLKEALGQTRGFLPNASLIYADTSLFC
ncbi:GDSL esterase/lipase [Pyrus ussuriensis x Pyrus communis]|uniref:GDSL esterase/lipase n=1 Tax=Pyrus ussuriensis x Pyrus communis TaxID=2448454 RepID=A0A5N5F9M3_9ROSA|nr:GDSL esterase/lipase [Pyrus ussuriensis x Pyrus communis]